MTGSRLARQPAAARNRYCGVHPTGIGANGVDPSGVPSLPAATSLANDDYHLERFSILRIGALSRSSVGRWLLTLNPS